MGSPSKEGFLTEQQREVLKIASAINAEVMSTSPRSPTSMIGDHGRAAGGGRQVRRTHSGKLGRVKKDGAGGKGTWGKLLDTDSNSPLDHNDPNYDSCEERIQLETARLYKVAGVNPLAGCFPTLATIPVWIGLYRALSNVAEEGLLTEGFFWIPSLSCPTTIASRQSGSGTSWLFPFVDGHPPLGWPDTLVYLVLPVLLVVSQYISAQVLQPPQA